MQRTPPVKRPDETGNEIHDHVAAIRKRQIEKAQHYHRAKNERLNRRLTLGIVGFCGVLAAGVIFACCRLIFTS